MTLGEMVTRVLKIIENDKHFDEDEIIGLLNRAVLRVAGGILRPGTQGLTFPLPDLFKIGSVDTTIANSVAMPSDYQRGLCFVANSNGQEIQIYDSFQQFAQVWPLMSYAAPVNGVCIQGKILYYQGIPSTQDTLTLHYYRYPEDMTSDASLPDGIPIEYHEELLVSYAAKEIYSLKEDGVDGSAFNTKKYEDRFNKALLELDNSIPSYAAPVRFFR